MGWHSQSCEVYSCFNLRRIYAPRPCYTVRCQGHKSLHYVWRIAVLSLTKKELHPFMAKTWQNFSLGELFSNRRKKNVGSKISHTIFQQFDLKKKKKKGRKRLNKLAAGQKYHRSDFYECLKFEAGFFFWAQEPRAQSQLENQQPQFKDTSPQCHSVLWLEGQYEGELPVDWGFWKPETSTSNLKQSLHPSLWPR